MVWCLGRDSRALELDVLYSILGSARAHDRRSARPRLASTCLTSRDAPTDHVHSVRSRHYTTCRFTIPRRRTHPFVFSLPRQPRHRNRHARAVSSARCICTYAALLSTRHNPARTVATHDTNAPFRRLTPPKPAPAPRPAPPPRLSPPPPPLPTPPWVAPPPSRL
jgi:hypothetical protein